MERDCRFDIMRGIGIILMMLGHIPVEGFAYRVIYSFHMPMFFLLSGYFANNAGIFSGGGVFASQEIIPAIITTICDYNNRNRINTDRSMCNAR